jgi:hypothetical protein
MQTTTVYPHECAALAAWSTMALPLAVFPETLDFTTDPFVNFARRLASTSSPAAPPVAVLSCANIYHSSGHCLDGADDAEGQLARDVARANLGSPYTAPFYTAGPGRGRASCTTTISCSRSA